MTDDRRWAARYAFLEDLWRDRARVIVDPSLESALRGKKPAAGAEDPAPLDELLDALVPRAPRARTWVAVEDEAVARELAQTRPGTGFLPRVSFADVVAHRDWTVALVDLGALSDAAPGGAKLRAQLGERAREGRTVIVSVRATPGADGEDAGFSALGELLDELDGGRLYGVYRPPVASVIDLGAADEDDEDDEDDEVSLSFDNTLGSQTPAFVEYLAVAGGTPALPEGMTLVELPPDTTAAVHSGDDALRTQLVLAQRQADLAAIDRNALLEKVDELEAAREELEQQAAGLRDQITRTVTEQPPEAAAQHEQLQATLADNQALRWKVGQLEREVAELRARPVEALEAEVAELRARLQAAPAEDEDEEALAEDELAFGLSLGSDEDDEDDDDDEVIVLISEEADDLHARRRHGTLLVELERLIARVERGGIGALPLRQVLVSLRRRLRTL